jgi:hypothetical protein
MVAASVLLSSAIAFVFASSLEGRGEFFFILAILLEREREGERE